MSSTDRAAAGINRRNKKPYDIPRRLAATELADQFLDSRVNDRSDAYGGSVENRCRFALELVELLLRDCGGGRIMVRISPSRWMDGIYDWPDLRSMLAYIIPAFDGIGLRLLDVSCARADYYETSGRVMRMIRPRWPHFPIGGASLTPEQAQAELDAGLLDMVTYGRLLIANGDLVERVREGSRLQAFTNELLETLE